MSAETALVYHRVMRAIAAELATGFWRSGDGLPSEAELAGYYDVSRRTVRKALSLLERQGVVAKGQGRRTRYLGRTIGRTGGTPLDFPSAARLIGFRPSTRLLRVAEARAGPTEARALRLPLGDPVLEIVRLRLLDGRVVVCQRSVLSRDIGAGLPLPELRRQSLYDLLRRHACEYDLVVEAEHLTLSHATAEESRWTRLPPDQSVVRMVRVVADESRRMIEYSNSILLGPYFSF